MKLLSSIAGEYDMSIIKSYLQLILRSAAKKNSNNSASSEVKPTQFENIVNFQTVLEAHFLTTKEVAFYAEKFGLAVNTFSKKNKKHFGKSPSKLLQE